MLSEAHGLHVAQIGFHHDPARRTPRELLEAWPTLVDVAESASRAHVAVSVIQACAHEAQFERNGVRYRFLPFGIEPAHGGLTPLFEQLQTLAPDVLHINGLHYLREIRALSAHRPDLPLMLQDHANLAPRPWRRPAWRRAFSQVTGIAFCAREQALPFLEARLLAERTRIYEIVESTSRFEPGDRDQARALTGMHGDPAVLWIGHLDANKDPLTMLDGVSRASAALPGLRLWCCFASSPLRAAVERRIAGDAHLRGRVHLLGRLPHERIEPLLRAADLFVLASHREGSGYALIEALACGLPPVVTDIPSFRALTGRGAVGRLWPCGEPEGLSQALQAAARDTGASARAAVRAHFEQQLSFQALGTRLAAVYRDLCERACASR